MSVTFDGFTALYEEATDEKEKKETALPPLEQGQTLKLRELKSEQKFTQPPARYTEATLIRSLEENGIGRPSTYAPTITTIIDRGYVERDAKRLKPTLLGRSHQRADDGAVPEHRGRDLHRPGWRRSWTRWRAARRIGTPPSTPSIRALKRTLETAEKNMEGKKIKVPDEETDVDLREVRPPHGHQDGPVRQVPGLPGLPGVHATPSAL